MRITPETRITIERKAGDLGFSLSHRGVSNNSPTPYECSCGDIDGLRGALLSLLDELEQNDQKTCAAMEHLLKNADLPQATKEAVTFSLKCWQKSLERNRRAKEKQVSVE